MDLEFPPLPSLHAPQQRPAGPAHQSAHPGPTTSSSRHGSVDHRFRGMEVASNGSKTVYKILSRDGDAVLEYVDDVGDISRDGAAPAMSAATRYRWQVCSHSLRRNSPFFAALLDPNKFAEGRLFQEKAAATSHVKQQQQQQQHRENLDQVQGEEGLPLVSLNLSRLTGKHRIEILDLFLKVIQSFSSADSDDDDEHQNARLAEELGRQPTSLVAGVLEVADLFSSSNVIHDALKRARYVPSLKGNKVSLLTFSPSLLKLSEERVRQILYIALVLENQVVFQVMSHTLVLLGSTSWTNGFGVGKHGSHRWSFFPNGIEEELYYRRQSILNTITDLQAHFLRVFGALGDDTEQQQPSKSNRAPTAVVSHTRPIQCRWGFSNSRACDSFHLGEMVRFFSLRSRTIFLGSTLLDPHGEEDDQDDGDYDVQDEDRFIDTDPASSDIPSITASLRQIPDYQIDPNHTGCGIRRRLLPALDCIDGFLGHRRAPVGLQEIRCWKQSRNSNTYNADSWKDRGRPPVETVDIHAAKIVGVRVAGRQKPVGKGTRTEQQQQQQRQPAMGKPGVVAAPVEPLSLSPPWPISPSPQRGSPEAEARILFTAKKRCWES